MTELSDIEADSEKEQEEVAEAAVVKNPTQKSRSKKKKAHSKKELKGVKILPMFYHTVYLSIFFF